MATVASIRVVKQITFKGGLRHYSNRYAFTGGTPADSAHWTTLSDAIVTAEKAIHYNNNTILQTVGYAAGSDVPVFSKNYTTVGTLTAGATNQFAPGEVAALVRWSTSARSSKNHPIYCFSYYHGVLTLVLATVVDKLEANQKTAMGTYATAWVTGFSDGVNTYVRATPSGHTATGSVVEQFVTHRDFPPTTSL
jgi:hypothetical protein